MPNGFYPIPLKDPASKLVVPFGLFFVVLFSYENFGIILNIFYCNKTKGLDTATTILDKSSPQYRAQIVIQSTDYAKGTVVNTG